MAFKILFSVVDFRMNNEKRPDKLWFDLEDTSSIKTAVKIVPLFNTFVNDDHVLWDDGIAAEIKIIINLVKTTYIENQVVKEELISYEAPLDQFDSERHVYEINVDFNIDEIKHMIEIDSFYTINLSYILEDSNEVIEDLLKVIDSNTFFSTPIPFSKDGGWLHGK